MMMNIRNSFIFDYKTSFGNGFVPNFIEIGVAFYLWKRNWQIELLKNL